MSISIRVVLNIKSFRDSFLCAFAILDMGGWEKNMQCISLAIDNNNN
jgi:hypothetical protein